jgi:O-acetyl-ADP-ribose deacetylase (regulator of RNase III)
MPMQQKKGDLWIVGEDADAVVVTTNGSLWRRKEPEGLFNPMGGGCAKEAADRFPWLPEEYGDRIRRHGIHCAVFSIPAPFVRHLVCMPVKYVIEEAADIGLISQSAFELVEIADYLDWKKVVLPRPGCGLGGLDWSRVEPALAEILDERFTVVTFGHD